MPKHARLPSEERAADQAQAGPRRSSASTSGSSTTTGTALPHDGTDARAHLQVRGPVGRERLLPAPSGDARSTHDGWFPTGDIATIDPDGYMQITDRGKDVIKSGGEWISSIELENAAVGHPAVAQAAAIGVPHPKWDERPLLVVVQAPGQELDGGRAARVPRDEARRSGGCRTPWCSSTRCRSARPARC